MASASSEAVRRRARAPRATRQAEAAREAEQVAVGVRDGHRVGVLVGARALRRRGVSGAGDARGAGVHRAGVAELELDRAQARRAVAAAGSAPALCHEFRPMWW